MKIALVNTYDVQGGAARAAYRLHQGLQKNGHPSTLISRHKVSSDATVVNVCVGDRPSLETLKATAFDAIQHTQIDQKRSPLTNTYFSLPYPGLDLSQLSTVQNADVINLHWVARFQSPATIHHLIELGKPVIWTLHDMWAFTGGCHFSAGCLKYQADCSTCPQLLPDSAQLTAHVLADKLHYLDNQNSIHNLTIVTPSYWLADCVRQSRLFKNHRVEVIPNSVEIDIFTPLPKPDAKALLGIAPDVTTILFGAMSATEERKGFSELIQAIYRCSDDSRFREQVEAGKVELLCVGHANDLLASLGIPVRSLGYIDSDTTMSQVYSAADVFALPSLEDNLPNTMLEAMSCGTPVVAFDVGGIPDVVKPQKTGWLAPVRNTQAFADALLTCMFNIDDVTQMGQMCRQTIVEHYSPDIQANQYLTLFEEVLSQQTSSGRSPRLVYPVQHPDQHSSPAQSGMEPTNHPEQVVPLDTTVSDEGSQFFDAIALNAVITSLHETKAQLHKAQFELQHAREELAKTRSMDDQRAALQEEIAALHDQLQTQEKVRARLINEMHEHNMHLRHRNQELTKEAQQHKRATKRLERRLSTEQSRLDGLSQEVERLYGELERSHHDIEHLKVGRVALRQVIKSLLRRVKLDRVLLKIRKPISATVSLGETIHLAHDNGQPAETPSDAQGIFPTRDTRVKSSRLPSSPSAEAKAPQPNLVGDTVIDMTAPLINGFVMMRDLNLDRASAHESVHESVVLDFFSRLADEPRRVFCLQPDGAIATLAQSLALRGAEVTCVACDEAIAHTTSLSGLTTTTHALAEWMAEQNITTLSDYDILCMGTALTPASWQLLRGRLMPTAKIVLQNATAHADVEGNTLDSSIPVEWRNPKIQQDDFWLYDHPPTAWHDPLAPQPAIDPHLRWPWNYPQFSPSPTLPSGKPWPKISIITVTYNQGAFIEETIRSVLMQGYPNLEYIVVDACSTDNTSLVLERYRKSLTHCIIEPDNGQADALNKGFRLATGDILAWLNSDDCYLPTTLYRVAMAFDHYHADLVAGGCQLRKGFSSEVSKTHHNAMPLGEVVPLPLDRLMNIEQCWQSGEFFYQPEVFWTKDLWDRCGGYLEENLFYSMDYELWLRMAYHHAQIVHTPEPFTLFRFHEQQKTYGDDIPFLPELKSVRDRYQRRLQ